MKNKKLNKGKRMNLPTIAIPRNAVRHPDTDRYKCRFTVRSESSNRLYMISFDLAPGAGYWKCSCPGSVAHGQCKHLTAAGLKGRTYGKDHKTIAILTSSVPA